MGSSSAQRTTGSTHFQETGHPLFSEVVDDGGYGGRAHGGHGDRLSDLHTPHAEARSFVAFGEIQAIVSSYLES